MIASSYLPPPYEAPMAITGACVALYLSFMCRRIDAQSARAWAELKYPRCLAFFKAAFLDPKGTDFPQYLC